MKTEIKVLFYYICCRCTNLFKRLTPSYHGEDCLFNGDHPEYECCCDECNYYLACFPDWEEYLEIRK